MKVRASVKEVQVQNCAKKGIVRYKQKNLDLNKDKDNYGKNSRVDIPKKIERCYSTYLYLRIRKSRAVEILEKLKLAR
jgi:hypothetical protein